MATYNFTVRATDNLGAYADRAFSLEVNNTNISRFVIVGTTGLIHSSNGATWNNEAGLSGLGVTFGNGNWVVWTGLNSNVIRKSPDAVSWTNTTATLSGTPVGYYHLASDAIAAGLSASTAQSTGFSMIKWVNDRFIGMTRAAYNSGGSTAYAALEYHSVDAVNWSFASIVHNIAVNSSPQTLGVVDFAYDGPTDTWVACAMPSTATSTLRYRVGSGAWTNSNIVNAASLSSGGATIINVNGLWMANVRNASNSVYTSVDGINWIGRYNGVTTQPYGLTYVNGRVVTINEVSSSSSTYNARTSLDGGRNWTALGPTYSNGTSSVTSANWSQNLAYYAGNFLWVSPGATSWIKRSTDDGLNFTNVTITGTSVGTPQAIFARQS